MLSLAFNPPGFGVCFVEGEGAVFCGNFCGGGAVGFWGGEVGCFCGGVGAVVILVGKTDFFSVVLLATVPTVVAFVGGEETLGVVINFWGTSLLFQWVVSWCFFCLMTLT